MKKLEEYICNIQYVPAFIPLFLFLLALVLLFVLLVLVHLHSKSVETGNITSQVFNKFNFANLKKFRLKSQVLGLNKNCHLILERCKATLVLRVILVQHVLISK